MPHPSTYHFVFGVWVGPASSSLGSVTMDELLSISWLPESLLVKLKRLDLMIADVPSHSNENPEIP